MNMRAGRTPGWIGALAKLACLSSLAAALVSTVRGFAGEEALGVRIESRREAAADVRQQRDATEVEVHQLDRQVADVNAAIEQKQQVQRQQGVDMQKVMARVRLLQDEQAAFQAQKADVLAHLQRMDDDYVRASALVHNVSPP
jgi:septal ring factor EnvC (AmiA/AmiB activator)